MHFITARSSLPAHAPGALKRRAGGHGALFYKRIRGIRLVQEEVAYVIGKPLKPTSDTQVDVDYSPLLGFVLPAVRIDPHSHKIDTTPQIDLRQIADIIRDRRRTDPPSPAKSNE
jgi:hypothetical protein